MQGLRWKSDAFLWASGGLWVHEGSWFRVWGFLATTHRSTMNH